MNNKVMVYIYPVKRLLKKDFFVRGRICASKMRKDKVVLNCIKNSRGCIVSATFK